MGCGASSSDSGNNSGKKPGAGKKPAGPQRDLDELCKQMQEDVGSVPKISVGSFENWGENVKLEKILICEPASLPEIQVGFTIYSAY